MKADDGTQGPKPPSPSSQQADVEPVHSCAPQGTPTVGGLAGIEQPATQVPALQVPAVGHVVPHPPQLLGSVCPSTQTPPQKIGPLPAAPQAAP